MNTVTLPDGTAVPALGLGTWRMGESARERAAEVRAVRLAIQLGYRLIDTAEMYGEGGAEEVVGRAVGEALRAGEVRRDELFVVSKVYPHNASRRGTAAACERSLERLRLDRIDLYLLHWRGQHPLADTVEALRELEGEGRIARWGVSNFDTADMAELAALPGGAACAANQVYYSLGKRGVEFDLLPWLRARAIPAMAYCPIDQGALSRDGTLAAVGARIGATAAQVALAWAVAQPGVIVIPKAVREAHLRENLAAASLTLDAAARAELDRRFPPPDRKQPLAMS
jgi:diketogulonate reductase-like aldo/keto reductase